MNDIDVESVKEKLLKTLHFIGGSQSDFLTREIYKGINIAGESFDKFCIGTLVVSGAVASTIFVQIESLTKYVQECGAIGCFWMIFCSCVFGLLVLYTMILRRISINSQMSIYSLSESIDEVEWNERFDADIFIDDIYKELPWVILPSKWYAKKRSKKAFFPYQQAAYWACWQMFFVAVQVLFLVLSFLPLALNVK